MKAPFPPNEVQRLETLRGYDVLDTLPEPAFDDLTLLAAQICQVPIALISLVDENRQWFKSTIGLSATETSRDFAFCAHAILYSEEVLEVSDAQLDLRFADNPLVTADPHIRFYAGAPLVTPDGLALGTLCVIDRVPRVLSSEQKTALRALSHTVIAQLELRRALAAHHRAQEQLELLNASLEQKIEARTAELRREMEVRRESESRLHSILDAALDAVIGMDAQGRIIDWNARAETLFCWTKGEALGLALAETIIPEQHKEAHRHGLARYLATGEERLLNRRIEITAMRRNGEEFPIELAITPFKTGNSFQFTAFIADITDRKQAKEALQDSEQRFRDFSRSTADWFWEMDADLHFTYFSDNFERYYGVDRNRVLGKTRRALMAPENLNPPDIVEAHLAQIERHEPFREFHYRIRDVAGQICWFSISGVPVFDPTGQFAGYRGMGQNVTERKQAEEQLRLAAAAFESQEGMMITDAHSVILRVNRAFTEITGYSAEEAVGQTPRLLQSDHHNEDFYRAMWETIQSTGGWEGEIWDRRKNGEIYPKWLTITAVKADDGTVTHYVGTHTDITARKAADEQIAFLAYHDALTRLPNRLLLLDRLQQALASSVRSGHHGALFLLDLDNFKTLNDTLGHDKGDLLLQQVAQRLATCVRAGDTVARLGGDEFVVLLEALSEHPEEAATQTETLGGKILAALSQPYLLAGHETRSTPSIGITLFNGHQAAIEELLKQADLAMYQSKTAGRNTLRFFDPEMQVIVNSRAALEVDLRAAVTQQQFVLHYQAQVHDDGRVTGAEALVRWQHPQRGMVPPAEFIPLAEETNLILPLGLWVLETACAQLTQWADQPNTAHLSLAVNISANQLHQADFVDQVLAVLGKTGANPKRLKLELTESLLVSNVETTIAKMSALKALGVCFSLDDFGTGYSSLAYLKRLPLDQLKIDQGFVKDILNDTNDAAIAKMVIALAESMGLPVIAEGVETEAQRDFLAGLGCHAYQGYLFSRPLPLAEFEAFVASPPSTSPTPTTPGSPASPRPAPRRVSRSGH